MFSLRLGNLSSLLSESLVNGFTTGAAMHVLSSQLKDLFGLKIPRHVGYLQIIYVSHLLRGVRGVMSIKNKEKIMKNFTFLMSREIC